MEKKKIKFIDFIKRDYEEEFVEKIMNGEITDSKTQIAVLKTARLLGK